MSSPHTLSASDFIDHGSETYSFLPDPVVDALIQVVIELGTESWVTRRRMMVLERVMEARGILAGEAIETYVPTEEEETLFRQERDRMLKSVYSALARRPDSRDAAAERAKGPDAPKRAPYYASGPVERARAKGPSGV
jgi:hypothetical protein